MGIPAMHLGSQDISFFSILHCFACRTKSEGLILERYRLNLFALNWNEVCFPERAQAALPAAKYSLRSKLQVALTFFLMQK
jgi:hypothetical protein